MQGGNMDNRESAVMSAEAVADFEDEAYVYSRKGPRRKTAKKGDY